MMFGHILRPAAAGVLILLAGQGASAQRQVAVTALKTVERGQWLLKERDGAARHLCLTNPEALLQIHHDGLACERVVMEDGPRAALVRYTCPGHGHGRTSISVETSKLVRFETQGVADGAPFAEEYEARLAGRCG
jgi:hypothetical protein